MAYDGYFNGSKTVPARPISRTSAPLRRPTPTSRPNVPRSPRSPDFSIPAKPRDPVYGTAVPTTPKGAYQGMPRSRQFLRWFMPTGFDQWGYISSFSYIFTPVKQGGSEIYVPEGWGVCGDLKGEIIPNGIHNGPDRPFVCELIPMGGQHAPYVWDEPLVPTRWVAYEQKFTDPFVGGTWHGLVYRDYSPGLTDLPRNVEKPAVQAPVRLPVPWLGVPQPRPGTAPRPIPWAFQPGRAEAPHPSMGPTRSYSGGKFAAEPYTPSQPGRPQRPVAPTNPHKPPPPRTKERKGKVPKWFATLSKVAWEATEAVDVVENLFDCLPKRLRKTAPKTGVTLPDAWQPGIAYTSAIDKARHVYRHHDQLDLDCAMRKLACNHVMDMLWGRFFGGVDSAAQKAGLKGFGNAASSSSGLYIDKKHKEAFDKWISENPALDALRKSLDCENLGRS